VVPAERFCLAAAVYGVLRDGDRVLLLRRAGSGYHDGELSLPAGHLDGGEDALSGLVRELREELTIGVDRDTCRLALVMHRPPEAPGDHEYLDLFFAVTRWDGVPAIGEPDKCSELVWANSASLPADTIGYIRAALDAAAADTPPLLTHGWDV
jgi:8-oxo-dGTP pyrophosphatase MutT (NUDIX family)